MERQALGSAAGDGGLESGDAVGDGRRRSGGLGEHSFLDRLSGRLLGNTGRIGRIRAVFDARGPFGQARLFGQFIIAGRIGRIGRIRGFSRGRRSVRGRVPLLAEPLGVEQQLLLLRPVHLEGADEGIGTVQPLETLRDGEEALSFHGLAAAHGLGIGWHVPIAGYSSLALIAAAAVCQAGELAVALHGGHGQLFVQTYGRNPLHPRDALRSLVPDAAAAAIAAEFVIGSGAASLVDARGSGTAVDALPRAADARLLPAPLRSLPVRPIYGRAPDAKPQP